MASRVFTGGLGRRHLRFGGSKLKVSVVGGGLTRHHGVVSVNPADFEATQSLFRASSLDRAFETRGDVQSLPVSSVFSSAFQRIALLGLVAGRGVDGSTRELVKRALPDLPSQVHVCAQLIEKEVIKNRRLIRQLALRQRPLAFGGSAPGSSKSDSDLNPRPSSPVEPEPK
ncbi:hypothetical protein RND81_04G142400 [Saponaria officinalis]|uniref:Uncharacterized protein n=1 Tax=Saponaria officinalis TaxID=3572 RepID=A0AAW1LJD1_SAPOF